MNRIYDDWDLATPVTNWDKFSANVEQSNGVAGVGTTHFPANAQSDYDTFNTRIVQSWADDFLNYPTLTGTTQPVNRDTWGRGATPDYERDYQKWYFAHLPRAAGVNADGKQNNWWKYLYDFNNYTESGIPKPLSAAAMANPVYNTGDATYDFSLVFSGAVPVDISMLDGSDVRVTGPGGFNQPAQLLTISDDRDDTHVVATYRISAPGGVWDATDFGSYTISLQNGQVANILGQALSAASLATFRVGNNSALELPNDADTNLLLRFNGNTNGAAGETASTSTGTSFESGRVGQAVQIGTTGDIRFSNVGNLAASEGTVEFWIKPNWNGTGNSGHTFFQAGESFNNGMLLSIDGADNLRFIQWGDDPATPAVETDVERGVSISGSDWVSGQWHHFAATWNGATGQMSLYVDGQLTQSISNGVKITSFVGSSMSIGRDSGGGSPADSAFDEFRISGRSRLSSEIQSDFMSGLSIASIAVDANQTSMLAGNSQWLRATATDTSGVTRDVTPFVRWSSSIPSALQVDAEGRVLAAGAGTATITAQLSSLTATISISVTNPQGPTATFNAADVNGFGATSYDISVLYADNTGVSVNTLGVGDLRVTGPNGFSGFLSLVSTTPSTNGTPVTGQYRFVPPGGYWDPSDNGTYTVSLMRDQVQDIVGNTNGRMGMDTFDVRVAPKILSPAATTAEQRPVIRWESVKGATGIDVWINNLTTGQSAVVNTTVVGDQFQPASGLGIGNYRIWVRSVHLSGFRSQWSLSSDFRVNTPVAIQSPVTQQNTARPSLTWNSLPGAVKYDLWINDSSTGQTEVVRKVNLTSTTWTSDTDMPLGQYRAWVRGIDAKGVAAQWSAAVNFGVVPGPVLVSPLYATFNQRPAFTWNPVVGATRYDVYVRNQTTAVIVHYPRDVAGTTWTPPSNLPDGPYRWWVQAISANNVRGLWSAPVDVFIGGRTTVVTPTSSTSDRTPTFSWRPVEGAVSYHLWVDRVDTAVIGLINMAGLTSTSWTPSSSLSAGTFRVWVRAVSSTGQLSPWSLPITFTVVNLSDQPSGKWQLATQVIATSLRTTLFEGLSNSMPDSEPDWLTGGSEVSPSTAESTAETTADMRNPVAKPDGSDITVQNNIPKPPDSSVSSVVPLRGQQSVFPGQREDDFLVDWMFSEAIREVFQ
ncbi:MAG: Ig-like domain-containing protein [Fuerstia sp.]|nr:Ig-like domain-containing protein [Fuerstiella sp.]